MDIVDKGQSISPEQAERYDKAYELCVELVNELNMEDIESGNEKSSDEKEPYFYKIVNDVDVAIYAQIPTRYSYVNVRFSLSRVAYDVIWLIERILDNDELKRVVKRSVTLEMERRNIDVFKLFDIEASEVDQSTKDTTKDVLKIFLANVAPFANSTILDAIGHSKLGYYKNILSPALREHWNELGLPTDFDLVTRAELDEVRKDNIDWRRWFLGDRKQFLSMTSLPDEAKKLRELYKSAKNDAIDFGISYRKVNRDRRDDLDEELSSFLSERYPALNPGILGVVREYRPFELANKHLAHQYGYNEESIRKKLRVARSKKQ